MKENQEKRSQIMRAVKGKNTAPEVLVRKIIYSLGYRYRLHGAHLPGTPDIYFTKQKKVVFINGCFWHGHDCKRGARLPKSNSVYWEKKIAKNRDRDHANFKLLELHGWSILEMWECQLKEFECLKEALKTFLER